MFTAVLIRLSQNEQNCPPERTQLFLAVHIGVSPGVHSHAFWAHPGYSVLSSSAAGVHSHPHWSWHRYSRLSSLAQARCSHLISLDPDQVCKAVLTGSSPCFHSGLHWCWPGFLKLSLGRTLMYIAVPMQHSSGIHSHPHWGQFRCSQPSSFVSAQGFTGHSLGHHKGSAAP